jgi:rubrerythrin
LIYPKESLSVTRLLEIAIEGERYEHTTMYPEFERSALAEASAAAAKEFAEQAQESREHDVLFTRTLELARKRFAALAKVEKMHADRYQTYLDERSK